MTDPERTGSNRKMRRVEFGAACLTEIAKWIDQPAVRHVPKLWDSLVRLLIFIDDLSNDLVGAVDNAGCRKDAHSAHFRIERHQGKNVGFVCVVLERVDK